MIFFFSFSICTNKCPPFLCFHYVWLYIPCGQIVSAVVFIEANACNGGQGNTNCLTNMGGTCTDAPNQDYSCVCPAGYTFDNALRQCVGKYQCQLVLHEMKWMYFNNNVITFSLSICKQTLTNAPPTLVTLTEESVLMVRTNGHVTATAVGHMIQTHRMKKYATVCMSYHCKMLYSIVPALRSNGHSVHTNQLGSGKLKIILSWMEPLRFKLSTFCSSRLLRLTTRTMPKWGHLREHCSRFAQFRRWCL